MIYKDPETGETVYVSENPRFKRFKVIYSEELQPWEAEKFPELIQKLNE